MFEFIYAHSLAIHHISQCNLLNSMYVYHDRTYGSYLYIWSSVPFIIFIINNSVLNDSGMKSYAEALFSTEINFGQISEHIKYENDLKFVSTASKWSARCAGIR